LKIFFDVDHTILLSTSEVWALRPGLIEVLTALKDMGHVVYLWTASGEDHARRLVQRGGLELLVRDCFDKDPVTVPTMPDMVVDDDEFLVEKYKGILVTRYKEINTNDRELYRVLGSLRNGFIPIAESSS